MKFIQSSGNQKYLGVAATFGQAQVVIQVSTGLTIIPVVSIEEKQNNIFKLNIEKR